MAFVASLVLLLLVLQQAPSKPTFRSNTVVVEVDVVVTNRSGRPVRGLDRDDFTITEDGVPVEIATFAAVDVLKRRVMRSCLRPTAQEPRMRRTISRRTGGSF